MPAAMQGMESAGLRNFYFLHFQYAASVCLLVSCYIPEKPQLGLADLLHPQTTPSGSCDFQGDSGNTSLVWLKPSVVSLEISHARWRGAPILSWALHMG